jgi:uncharacterized protein (DUF1800 family)
MMRFRRSRAAAVLGLLTAMLLAAGCGSDGPSFTITQLGLLGGPLGQTATGVVDGGDELVLMGVGFEEGITVLFDGIESPRVEYISETELRVITPGMPEGPAAITLRNPDGSEVTLPDLFQFGVMPAISAVAPVEADARTTIEGGIEMEVAGTEFRDGAVISVEGVAAETTFVDESTLRFDLPARDLEADVEVTVRNPSGLTGRLPGAFFQTQEHSLAPHPDAISDDQLHHLIQRAGFGAPPEELESRYSNSVDDTVRALMGVRRDAATAAVEADALLVYGDNPPPTGDLSSRTNQEWWIHLMRHSPNTFQERLAWFLHDHFATGQSTMGSDERWWMHEQIRLFRRFGMPVADGGLDYDWRALLVEICKDRAMLDWLDGTNSRKGRPNENFARELWELFMLGEGRGYTQADIEEASRAFTGFDDVDVEGTDPVYETVIYFPERHDEEQKTIFGVTGYFGYDNVAPYYEGSDTTAADPRDIDGGIVALTLRERPMEASTFICRKLFIYFVHEEPSSPVVDELAQLLRDHDWNLRPVLDRILKCKAMFSRRARTGVIKMPIEFVMQFLRNAKIDYEVNRTRSTLDRLRQSPLSPPDVAGWERGVAWMSSQAMVERINFLRAVVDRLDDNVTQIEPFLPPVGDRTAASLVDHIARLLAVELDPVARGEFETYVVTTLDGDGNEVAYDFDPTDETALRMKARGLLYLIAQYHQAHRH